GFSDCAPTCDQSKKSAFQSTSLAAEISLGAGVVAALGALFVYLVRRPVEHVEHIDASGGV
ncbi:MAG TPA: hypothetical protein VKE69_14240, partial [Planctomycetota bacterium]|nr:hypothetical protein [Planctomycetota bacterium]